MSSKLAKAETLYRAIQSRKAIPRLTAEEDFSIAVGYEIQEELLKLQAGQVVGLKMGMTSKAKMLQMKIDAPIFGVLTKEMLIANRAQYSLSQLIHPRIEPEIAFLTKRELSGNPSGEEALAACESVAAALEVIDSRYEDFSFTLADVVADNCSAAGFVIGAWHPISVPVDNLGMVLKVNGSPVQFGSSAALLGDPVLSLVELVKLLAKQGKSLPAGSIVLAGAATAAVPLNIGDHVAVEVEKLGTAEIYAC